MGLWAVALVVVVCPALTACKHRRIQGGKLRFHRHGSRTHCTNINATTTPLGATLARWGWDDDGAGPASFDLIYRHSSHCRPRTHRNSACMHACMHARLICNWNGSAHALLATYRRKSACIHVQESPSHIRHALQSANEEGISLLTGYHQLESQFERPERH